MSGTFVLNAVESFDLDPMEPTMASIFQQYERVIVESLITSFGLDFIVKDQHGGDVDTIHNVRQIGKDAQMTYKNDANQTDYENRGSYNTTEYHSDSRYIEKNREVSNQKKEGKLTDAYTGEKIGPKDKTDLDHTISAKEIHDDRARVLSGLRGVDLANSDENLHATNPKTNRSKGAGTMEQHLERSGDKYTDEQKANMRKKDTIARKSYEAKLARAYYTSPKFATDLTLAAVNVGAHMGARQALGFVFAEIWFTVKVEFQALEKQANFDFGDFFNALGRGVKQGYENAKEKYNELFSRFLNGAVAGALSSITTTLCNIFFTTAKNIVRLLRQAWASLVEAAKILFINPDSYTFGERMRAVVKVLATGASILVGIAISETIGNTPIGIIPGVGDIVKTFFGTLVTGIMSCSLLYLLDRNTLTNKLVKMIDSLPTVEKEIRYYRQQAEYFEKYAAELMNIDLETFKKETAAYNNIAANIENARTKEELSLILENAFKVIGMPLPWEGHENFDDFMNDENARLVFK